MTDIKISHDLGHCPDPIYGTNCNGAARWTIDPYVDEIYGEEVWGWFCDGVLEGKRMDI